MREILYRGFCADTQKWVYGYYSGPVGIFNVHEITDINDPNGCRYDVVPESVGECTFKRQWDVLDPNVDGVVYENDIVEVVSERVPSNSYYPESQYDGCYRIRGVVYYDVKHCMWCLDYNNSFNRAILRLRGNEQIERSFNKTSKLGSFNTDNCWEHESRKRNYENRKFYSPNYFDNLKVIGNTFQNPELLKADHSTNWKIK